MAEALNVSVNTYGKIENGTIKLVDYKRINLLAIKLEVSVAVLLGVNEVQQTFYKKVKNGYIKTIHTLNTDNHELVNTLNRQLQVKDKEIERLTEQNTTLMNELLKKLNAKAR
jgi:transcriptional regulator with XRE-family HTH domain